MATNLSSWYPEINGIVPGVPAPVQLKKLRDSVREFCEKTLIWRKTLTEIDIVADTKEYALSYSGAEIILIEAAAYKGPLADDSESDDDQYSPLTPASEEVLDKIIGGAWEFRESTAPSEYYTNTEVDTIYFTEIPTVASTDGLRVKVRLKPDDSATVTTVEDIFWKKYKDAITDGAVYRLFKMSAMPWGDPKMSEYHKGLFNQQCDVGKWNRIKAGVKRSLRVRPVRVF